jgi:hypothetical protein
MLLISHILIALTSVIYTGFVYIAPSRAKLNASYGLVALTIASGTWLIIANPAHMVQSCLTGLLYLGVMFVGIYLSYLKLAKNEINSDK